MTNFRIGKDCRIHPSVVINVESGFLGAGSVVNEGARIEGTHVEIGREAFIDRYATIGGGSCFDPQARLIAGDWFHMGVSSQLNTARGITVGHEFGCGVETKVFTHGAYIDSYSLGAPVQWAGIEIGDSVWLPNAWVNPGVKIGSNVIVAARSLINSDLPSGVLAGGTPCKILKSDYLPREISVDKKQTLVEGIFAQAILRYEKNALQENRSTILTTLIFDSKSETATLRSDQGETHFNLRDRVIDGSTTHQAELFKDQMRRNGIRFRFSVQNRVWVPWGQDQLSFS